MNNRGAVMAEAIVPFAPKSNARAETGDPLDRAGQTILSALDRAAGAAEEKYRQAVETTHKVSAQLRAAEDQIRELEGKARYQANRADRAEKWLYQISVEVEQKFFGRADERPSPAPPGN